MPEYRTKVIVDLSTFSFPRFADRLGANRARRFFGKTVSVAILTLGKTSITLHHVKGMTFEPITVPRADVARLEVERRGNLRRSIIKILTTDAATIIVAARRMSPELLDALGSLALEGRRAHPLPPQPMAKIADPTAQRMSPVEGIFLLLHFAALAFALAVTISGRWGPVGLAFSTLLLAGLSWPLFRMWRRSPRQQTHP